MLKFGNYHLVAIWRNTSTGTHYFIVAATASAADAATRQFVLLLPVLLLLLLICGAMLYQPTGSESVALGGSLKGSTLARFCAGG